MCDSMTAWSAREALCVGRMVLWATQRATGAEAWTQNCVLAFSAVTPRTLGPTFILSKSYSEGTRRLSIPNLSPLGLHCVLLGSLL